MAEAKSVEVNGVHVAVTSLGAGSSLGSGSYFYIVGA